VIAKSASGTHRVHIRIKLARLFPYSWRRGGLLFESRRPAPQVLVRLSVAARERRSCRRRGYADVVADSPARQGIPAGMVGISHEHRWIATDARGDIKERVGRASTSGLTGRRTRKSRVGSASACRVRRIRTNTTADVGPLISRSRRPSLRGQRRIMPTLIT
jgi:hypothetical protein